jgi:hypothetical protein
MFTKRLVSGIILVILAIIIVGKGGALLYGVTALISLIGLFELYRVLKIEKNAIEAKKNNKKHERMAPKGEKPNQREGGMMGDHRNGGMMGGQGNAPMN